MKKLGKKDGEQGRRLHGILDLYMMRVWGSDAPGGVWCLRRLNSRAFSGSPARIRVAELESGARRANGAKVAGRDAGADRGDREMLMALGDEDVLAGR